MPDLDRIGKYRDPSRARQGRDGHGLPQARPGHRAAGRDQDDPRGVPLGRRVGARRRLARFKREAQAGGRLHAPRHRRRLRVRRGRADGVHRHGVRAGYRAARIPEPPDLVRLCAARCADDATAECTGVRPSLRRGSPRHKAVEPDRHANRAPQGRRLRRRPGRHVEPDGRRHGDRHAVLHVTGAVHGKRGRRALRHLQHRRRTLRAAHRPAPVHRFSRGHRLQDLS